MVNFNACDTWSKTDIWSQVRVKLYQHGHRGKNAICKVGNWKKYPCQGRHDIRKPVKSLSIHEVTSNLSNEYASIHGVGKKECSPIFSIIETKHYLGGINGGVQVISRHYRHLKRNASQLNFTLVFTVKFATHSWSSMASRQSCRKERACKRFEVTVVKKNKRRVWKT